jgi:hypothetical protein
MKNNLKRHVLVLDLLDSLPHCLVLGQNVLQTCLSSDGSQLVMFPALRSAMLSPYSIGHVHLTSGNESPFWFVIVPPVGLQALAAHNANCPVHIVILLSAKATVLKNINANVNIIFMLSSVYV